MNLNQTKYIRLDTSAVSVSLCVYLAYVILPTVSAILPQILRYGVLLVIFGLFAVGAILFNRKSGGKTALIFCAVTVFILLMYLGKWRSSGTDFISYVINAYMFWLPLMYVPAVSQLGSETKRKIYLFAVFLFMVTVLTTIAGSIVHADSSRIMASGVAGESGAQVLQYSKLNIGGYGFVYGLVVFMPFLFYGARRLNHKWIYITFIILSVITVVLTQYSIALVAVVALVAAVIVFTRKNIALSVSIVSVAILVFFLLKDSIVNLLSLMTSVFYENGLNFLSDRLGLLVELLSTNVITGHALVRQSLYQMSLDAFLVNPLAGNLLEYHTLGGHSELLDILGAIGIFGFVFFLIAMSNHVKGIRLHKGTNAYKHCIFSFLIFVFVAMFNTVLTSSPIAVALFLIPAILPEEGSKGLIKITTHAG